MDYKAGHPDPTEIATDLGFVIFDWTQKTSKDYGQSKYNEVLN